METTPDPAPAPQLAAPGAGLPAVELFVARRIFAWQRWRTSRAAATARFMAERDGIMALVRSCDSAVLGQRVLIDRLRGLEDSSRHWSVYMTLDHLRIVNLHIAETITLLLRGETPARVASTAAVKPSPAAGPEVVAAFAAACAAVDRSVAAAADLRTRVRYAHPWFGPLDAASWHFLAGFHQSLHRGQVERILASRAH